MKISDKNKKRIRLGYSILISLMLVIVGILFMSSCYSIYKIGDSPFTRESISAAFSRIAVWVYITLSMIVIGFGIFAVMPQEKEKLKGLRHVGVVVDKLSKKANITEIGDDLRVGIERERKLRHILGYVRLALVVLCATIPLIHLLNPANFPAVSGRFNAEISHGMLVYLAFLSPLFVFEVVYVILRDLSYEREYELLKSAVKEHGISENVPEISQCLIAKWWSFIKENEKPIVLGIRIAFVGCAVLFIILGVLNGGMADVNTTSVDILNPIASLI